MFSNSPLFLMFSPNTVFLSPQFSNFIPSSSSSVFLLLGRSSWNIFFFSLLFVPFSEASFVLHYFHNIIRQLISPLSLFVSPSIVPLMQFSANTLFSLSVPTNYVFFFIFSLYLPFLTYSSRHLWPYSRHLHLVTCDPIGYFRTSPTATFPLLLILYYLPSLASTFPLI